KIRIVSLLLDDARDVAENVGLLAPRRAISLRLDQNPRVTLRRNREVCLLRACAARADEPGTDAVVLLTKHPPHDQLDEVFEPAPARLAFDRTAATSLEPLDENRAPCHGRIRHARELVESAQL